MAKEKKSVADLDAELAALEAELAALEGKGKKPAAKAPPAETKPRFGLGKKKEEAPPAPEAATIPPPEPKAKRAFGFGRKKETPEAQAPPPVETPVQAVAPPRAPAPPMPAYDLSLWRHEEGAWIRSTGRGQAVVRRVLDEEDKVVREEPASLSELEQNETVKAERGARRFFGRK